MIKVVSYCRVSTDKSDQANSFEAQQRYFREYIQHHPDWELYEIYADEGITGTSTKRRTQFNRMIQDAYDGKFQRILTKEVSRFSRNILDTISYTRELKELGISVQFLLDGIDTAAPDAELHLSIMASLAQEESRKTSSRVVWGQTRQMERGVVFGHSMLGYTVRNGQLSIDPEGAQIVRLIFQKYALEQVSTAEIARYLTVKGYHTYHGNTKWNANYLIKVLKNEKYVGDLTQKKTYTPNYLTHEKKTNKGSVPLVYITQHHEPIISRKLWNMAQERLAQNNKHQKGGWGHSNRYVFSGKIKCEVCGASFVGRSKQRKDGTTIRRWRCGTATREGCTGCDIGILLQEDTAMELLKTAIRSLSMNSSDIIRNVTKLALDAIGEGEQGKGENPQKIQYELGCIRQKKEAILDSYFSKELSKDEMLSLKSHYEKQEASLIGKLSRLQDPEKQTLDTRRLEKNIHAEVSSFLKCEEDSEVFFKAMLERMTVSKDHLVTLHINHLSLIFLFCL